MAIQSGSQRALCLIGLLLAISAFPAAARAAISGVDDIAFLDGSPLAAATAPGDPHHLFVALRDGRVQVIDLRTNTVAPQPLVTVQGVDTLVEGGLLGLAFHPNFASNGKFYTHATLDPGDANPGFFDPFVSTIHEYTISAGNPLVANPTPRTILEVPQPFANHNGGWIGFNPAASTSERSLLHVMIGDGGIDGGTPNHPGQSVTGELLGNVLRVDVDGDDFPTDANRSYAIPPGNPFVGAAGEDEVFAYGLRNPFQAGFDRATGDLWIGDVGEGDREEVNVIRAGGGGENFGWDACEGLLGGAACDALGDGVVDPVYDYSHPGQPYSPPEFRGRSVTGGLVYRGPDPEVQGLYIFGDVFPDFGAGGEAFWSLDAADPVGSVERLEDDLFPGEDGNTIGTPSGFVEDADGNVYILTLGGGVYRIETDALVTGDYNADGLVSASDYAAWRESLADIGADLPADGDSSGVVDAGDLTVWRGSYGLSAQSAPAAMSGAAPEPGGLGLAALAVALVAARQRRQQQHGDRQRRRFRDADARTLRR